MFGHCLVITTHNSGTAAVFWVKCFYNSFVGCFCFVYLQECEIPEPERQFGG